MFSRLRNKLRYLLSWDRIDRELARELNIHRDLLIEDEEQRGVDHATASLNARRRMGNTSLMMEHSRDAWLIAWLDTLGRDVRYALRSFRRNPGFTATVVLTLALGIGANTAIFQLVDTVMLRGLPVERAEELLAVRATLSYWRYEQLRERNEVFSDVLGARSLTTITATADGQPLGNPTTELVTGNYFSLLGVKPALGRGITPDDDRSIGAGAVAVISYGLWKRAFGGSADVLGRTLRMSGGSMGGGTSGFEAESRTARRDDVALTIVGVAPAEFFGDTVGKLVDIWVPLKMQPALTPGRDWITRRTAYWVYMMGRLRPGMSEAQARESLTRVWRQIRADEIGPSISEEQKRNIANISLNVEPGEKGFGQLRREFSQPLLVLMTVVTLVLLIACLNVANLLLARATARRQEIAMRLSLGAARARLVRQLLTESLLLATAGGALGLGVSFVVTRVLVSMVAGEAQQISLRLIPDWRILAFTAGVSIASGLLFGLIPALRGTRRDLQPALRESARTVGGSSRTTRVLVAAQIAVSLVLLVACGLFLRTLYNLKSEMVGYDRTGLILVRVDPVSAGYRGDALGRAIVELTTRVAALPGVRSATFSENGLFSGTESSTSVDIEGFKHSSEEDRSARFDQAGPGFFTGVGIPLILGRDFTAQDGPGAPRVAIINDTMARFYFGDSNPIGRHIRFPEDELSLEIVGVARDAQDHDLRSKPVRRLYVSYLQPIDGITTANLEIRAAGDPAGLLAPIRSEIQQFNPKLPILSLKSAQALIDESIVAERLVAKLSTWFGVLAVLLAAIGLYGVMSYMVARRTSEIGVRVALGASRRTIGWMVVRESLALVAFGSLIGAIAAMSLARFVETLVFGLRPHDPATLVASVVLLLMVALLAGLLPARRAASIDPLIALRNDQ